MARLKDRQRQIPNGLKFRIPEVNWQSQPFQSFDTIVNSVHTIIKANPALALSKGWPANRDDIAHWVDDFNARWCLQNGWHDYVTTSPGESAPKISPPPALAEKLAAGARTITDWMGEGATPVDGEKAAARAHVCAACPLNQPGDLSNFFVRSASELLKQQIETFKQLSMTTPDDDRLGVCAACSCPLRLKVHVPVEHILRRLPQASRDLLHETCWIAKESSL